MFYLESTAQERCIYLLLYFILHKSKKRALRYRIYSILEFGLRIEFEFGFGVGLSRVWSDTPYELRSEYDTLRRLDKSRIGLSEKEEDGVVDASQFTRDLQE